MTGMMHGRRRNNENTVPINTMLSTMGMPVFRGFHGFAQGLIGSVRTSVQSRAPWLMANVSGFWTHWLPTNRVASDCLGYFMPCP